MAAIARPDIVYLPASVPVQFACSCGQLKPITRIYFCRHCLKLRCGFCVCHEIDSIYCPNCSENMPSQEARIKKNKCSNCFECPVCCHTLSTRAMTIQPHNKDDKSVARKAYYLSCLSCRWTSRDVGIPDQSAATGHWPNRENVHAHRIAAVQERYRNLILWEKYEKQEKQRKKYSPRGKYTTISDKTGITAAIARKRAGLPEIPSIKPTIKEVEPAVAKEEVEGLPVNIFTEILDLNKVTTLPQRLLQPEWQPITVDKLFPSHKSLLVKRSQRCRTCEHNVSKPEYNPTSTKFKIHLLAYYHVPDVRLFTVEPLRKGRQCEMILKFINPTSHQTSITFLPLPTLEEEQLEIEEQISQSLEIMNKRDEPRSLGRESLLTSFTKQASLPEDPKIVDMNVNCDFILPNVVVVIPPKDDAAEYDDVGEAQSLQDDPNIVLWRKLNKVTVKLMIQPREDVEIGSEVVCGFTMQHTYMNAFTTENKEPRKVNHKVKIYLKVGVLVGNE